MKNILHLGRFFYAMAIIAFGIELFIYHDLSIHMPVPAGAPGRLLWVYALALLLGAGGLCIAANKKARLAATCLGVLFFVMLVTVHLPKLISNVYDSGAWTIAAETLALCGGSLIIATTLPAGLGWNRSIDKALRLGDLFFAGSLIIFSIQHFRYADFIAGLVPQWIPGRLFWAYFVSVAFCAAAISIRSNIKVRLSTTLLGIMFLVWVVILHAPRVAAHPHSENEWTSLFMALAMAGISFALASTRK